MITFINYEGPLCMPSSISWMICETSYKLWAKPAPVDLLPTTSKQEEFKKRFKLVCKCCGSENVVMHFDEGYVYSELTINDPSLTFGCNDCQENDFIYY